MRKASSQPGKKECGPCARPLSEDEREALYEAGTDAGQGRCPDDSDEAAFDHSGFSVASAGDVNGDGFADLIIGARYSDPSGGSSGASYVVFGKASGFVPNLNLSTLDGTTGFQINGEAMGDYSGLSGDRDEFHLASIVQNLKTLALRLIKPPPDLAAA